MTSIQKLHFIIDHPDTGHLLYGFMDHLANGRTLTEPQIIRIDKVYNSIIENKLKPCWRKVPYDKYIKRREQRKQLILEKFEEERIKRRERINPTQDAKNARLQLKKDLGKRKTFYGVFERMGTKENWYTGDIQMTILLTDIVDENNIPVADHIWLNFTKGFQELNGLTMNAWIQFDARIKPYKKGYVNFKKDIGGIRYIDYTLSYPSRIQII